MEDLKKAGFTQVIHTFSENDRAFCKQTVKDIVSITKDAGLDVYIDPWGVGRVFGGEAFSLFVETHLEEGIQLLNDGKPVGNACPNNPLFRDFMKEWIADAAWTGAEYVLWDEPHFYFPTWIGGRPNTWGCLCRYCRPLYEEKYGEKMPDEETEQMKIFKRDCLCDFLSHVTTWAHEAGLRNALCVLPDIQPSQALDRWEPFSRLPHLDIFGTDPYWVFTGQPVSIVGEYSRILKGLCEQSGAEPQIWIQGFKIPEGREHEPAEAIQQAADAGIPNLAVWGFEACEHLSWIRPDNPKKTWETVISAFQKVSRK